MYSGNIWKYKETIEGNHYKKDQYLKEDSNLNENPNCGKSRNEKFANSSTKLRGKHFQQIRRGGRENYMH